jgi:hypothetical protein
VLLLQPADPIVERIAIDKARTRGRFSARIECSSVSSRAMKARRRGACPWMRRENPQKRALDAVEAVLV